MQARLSFSLGGVVPLAATTWRGTIVIAGTRGTPSAPGFNPDHVVFKELRLLGALGVDCDAYTRALDLLASGKYPFADLPRKVADLDTLEPLIKTMAGEGDADIPVHAVVTPGAQC